MNETREAMRRVRPFVLIIVALIVWGSMSPHMRPTINHPPTTHH